MDRKMTANYHTHSRWCRHGKGEIEEYIEEGLRCGLKELAITEHVPQQREDSWIPWEQFPLFDDALNRAVSQYEGRIHVIKGFECEYYPQSLDNYRRFQEDFGYELLFLGQHRCGKRQEYDVFRKKGPDVLYAYAEDVCRGLQTGLFRYLAHPDCVLVKYRKGWDQHCEECFRQIFQACEELHIPVEINANGVRGHREYPSWEVFRLSRSYDLQYLINSDAHTPEALCDNGCAKAAEFARRLQLPVLERLS